MTSQVRQEVFLDCSHAKQLGGGIYSTSRRMFALFTLITLIRHTRINERDSAIHYNIFIYPPFLVLSSQFEFSLATLYQLMTPTKARNSA